MRIHSLTIFFMFLLASPAFAQFKLGLKFAPSLSFNRVENTSTTQSLSADGTAGRFIFGLTADYHISDLYAFSSGILYAPKRAAIEFSGGMNEEYKVQYLQVPLSLKLFTNEVALDKKIYFQIGGLAEVLINDEAEENTNVIIQDFRLFDFSLLLGSGLEYKIGTTNVLYAGFSYSRGLVNIVSEDVFANDDLEVRNDMLSLEIGIKF